MKSYFFDLLFVLDRPVPFSVIQLTFKYIYILYKELRIWASAENYQVLSTQSFLRVLLKIP